MILNPIERETPMSKQTYLVRRNGETRLRLIAAEVEAEGVVTVQGAYVLDGELCKADGCFDQMAGLAKSRKWSQIPRRYLGKVGTSESGLEIISEREAEEVEERRRRVHLAAHPEIAEMQEIESLYERSEEIIQGEDERYDRGYGYNLRSQADARLRAWREKYPVAARERDAGVLDDKAEHLRSLAVGALTYDADGWISPEEQRRRHDEMMAESAEIQRRADTIRLEER